MNRILVIDISESDFNGAVDLIGERLGGFVGLNAAAFDLHPAKSFFTDRAVSLIPNDKYISLDYLSALTKFCKEFTTKLEAQIEQEAKALKYYPDPQMVAKND